MLDYIHVVDLARGHLAALDALTARAPHLVAANLGTGRAVMKVILAVDAISPLTGTLPPALLQTMPIRLIANHAAG